MNAIHNIATTPIIVWTCEVTMLIIGIAKIPTIIVKRPNNIVNINGTSGGCIPSLPHCLIVKTLPSIINAKPATNMKTDVDHGLRSKLVKALSAIAKKPNKLMKVKASSKPLLVFLFDIFILTSFQFHHHNDDDYYQYKNKCPNYD